MKGNASLRDAIVLAASAHRGQVYPSPEGEPYVCHPLRLMLSMSDPLARMAAVLHDTVEDTNLRLEDLVDAGIPSEVVTAVERLTRRVGEDYEAYIERLADDAVARTVKIADLRDNLANNRRRPDAPGSAERITRYEAALARLTSHR